MPPLLVAAGMTDVRISATRSAVLGSAGLVLGIALKVTTSPLLLMAGGVTSWTFAGVARASWSLTRRGSVPAVVTAGLGQLVGELLLHLLGLLLLRFRLLLLLLEGIGLGL